MGDLLEQFITQECTAYVRHLLEDAIAETATPRSHFEFNRFEITIEREGNVVVLVDVLDSTEAGIQHVPLAAFTAPSGRARSEEDSAGVAGAQERARRRGGAGAIRAVLVRAGSRGRRRYSCGTIPALAGGSSSPIWMSWP